MEDQIKYIKSKSFIEANIRTPSSVASCSLKPEEIQVNRSNIV